MSNYKPEAYKFASPNLLCVKREVQLTFDANQTKAVKIFDPDIIDNRYFQNNYKNNKFDLTNFYVRRIAFLADFAPVRNPPLSFDLTDIIYFIRSRSDLNNPATWLTPNGKNEYYLISEPIDINDTNLYPETWDGRYAFLDDHQAYMYIDNSATANFIRTSTPSLSFSRYAPTNWINHQSAQSIFAGVPWGTDETADSSKSFRYVMNRYPLWMAYRCWTDSTVTFNFTFWIDMVTSRIETANSSLYPNTPDNTDEPDETEKYNRDSAI